MHQIEENWDEIKSYIKEEYELSSVSFNTWIEPLKFYGVEGDTVLIIIPLDQSHAKDYISKKYTNYFQVTITEKFDMNYNVKFLLEKDIEDNSSSDENKTIYNMNVEKANLNPKYNFDTFVVGKNNIYAHSAALAVAESPGNVYNPLFIYGGPGLGKTHLMHSIGHFVLEKNSHMRVLYVESKSYLNEVIESIRSGNASSMSNLHDKYRNIDVLLIDDIQNLIGKDATLEEFFDTFNYLHNEGKQIVLTSDKPPKDFTQLEERFISRFEWGLIADIQAPDFETKMAILKKNMESQSINIGDDVLEYIASNIVNIRELEGALKKVMASARIHPEIGITIETAENDLRDIIKSKQKKTVSPELIMNIITEHFEVSREDMSSVKRNSEIVLPRQVFMYICREYLPLPYKQIGKYVGGKDHSTVMHGIEKIENMVKEDREFAISIDTIRKKINEFIS